MARIAVVLIVTAAVLPGIGAQAPPTLDQLLDRMGAYLLDYETQLSSVVAEETFEQRIYGRIINGQATHLESDVAFMRLPGGAEWLGFRDVRTVNWKPVKTAGPSVVDVLSSNGGDIKKALAIANASARYNLGLPRTINVPTAPLDIIHPRYHDVHTFTVRGEESIDGVPTMIIGFEEMTRPTLVREPSGVNLVSSGRVWIEPASGTIRRVEWFYQEEKRRSNGWPAPRLRVDFERHQELGFMVPVRMNEVFSVTNARGEGKATYRNFRRFGTSARVVPQ
jgi:hypothetical protein